MEGHRARNDTPADTDGSNSMLCNPCNAVIAIAA